MKKVLNYIFIFAMCLFLVACSSETTKRDGIDPQIISEDTENDNYSFNIGTKDKVFNSVYGVVCEEAQCRIDDEKIISVNSWTGGTINFETYGIELLNNNEYKISFDIESDVSDSCIVTIGDYNGNYFEKECYPGVNSITYKHKENTFSDANLKISFSNNGNNEGYIKIDNFEIINNSSNNPNIAINQLGYPVHGEKIAIFKYNAGDYFNVINVNTNEIVYTGKIVGGIGNYDTGEYNFYGDFSSVINEGEYYITSEINGISYTFSIGNNLYKDVFIDAQRMISSQRCGMEIDDDIFSGLGHGICHDNLATIYKSGETIDVSGGWHDAGDFGRYVLPGVKTINDLLLAYLINTDAFTDDVNGLENGNGIPDILDEAKYELDWLLKMQIDWGPFYTAAVTENFAGFVTPDKDEGKIYVLEEENTSTAAASGAMALAYIVFKDIDIDLANQYLQSAKKGYEYALLVKGQNDIKNPPDIIAGDYVDKDDQDNIFFAASALYVATHDEIYLSEIYNALNKDIEFTGISYMNMAGYGSFLLLTDTTFKGNIRYKELFEKFMNETLIVVEKANSDGYHVACDGYFWGGNMYIADNAMLMLLANEIYRDDTFVNIAFDQISYLFGRNSLHHSYVTGYGINYPENIHHRVVIANKSKLNGALVGGPDSSIEGYDLPAAKMYFDNKDIYQTNEIAIYYNSPLIFTLSFFQD